MLGFAVALLPPMITGRRIQRGEGIFLVVALLVYVTLLIAMPARRWRIASSCAGLLLMFYHA